MKFNYQARNKDGQLQTGVVEASSKEAALSMLQNYGIYVTFLEEQKETIYGKKLELGKGASTGDLVLFTRQLSILLKASVPVVDAFTTLGNQTKKEGFQKKIAAITEKIQGGVQLSQALSLYPSLFSSFFIGMVKSGEASGKLADVLEYLANHLERTNNFYTKIITAMIYPVVVIFVFLIVIVLMVVMVIPQMSQVLEESGQELPVVTKFVINLSKFATSHWQILAFAFAAIVFMVVRTLRTKDGKEFIDRVSLQIPVVGTFLHKLYLSRFAENLSTLVSSGLPIIQALEITSNVIGNKTYKESVDVIIEGVKTGERISGVAQTMPQLYTPLFIQMVVVGERTGKLDTALLNVVEFYQKDVERSLDAMISMIEPLMIIGLGALVLGLMGSILLPIYQMGMEA